MHPNAFASLLHREVTAAAAPAPPPQDRAAAAVSPLLSAAERRTAVASPLGAGKVNFGASMTQKAGQPVAISPCLNYVNATKARTTDSLLNTFKPAIYSP